MLSLPKLDLTEFQKRRQHFLKQLPKDSLAFLTSAPEIYRNGDTHYPYRPNSDFYYLTGFNEPESAAVFIPGDPEGEFILFNREKDPLKEIWTGAYVGQEGAIKKYGAKQAYPISHLGQMLPHLLMGKKNIYYPVARNLDWDKKIMHCIHDLQKRVRSGISAPVAFHNIETILHEMRLIKSAQEITVMKQAAAITIKAHHRAMQFCEPGKTEYEIQAEIEHEFKKNQAVPAYGSIVGGGGNGCILHYVNNEAELQKGDLLLIDAGCEYQYYASDITRTFPINGKFTEAQRAIYELVLNTQRSVIDLVKPGTHYDALQEKACWVITEGLVNLGLLKGSIKTLYAQKAYAPFYMHNIGHWLGLDVHDAGSYKIEGQWRALTPGMVLTVEPGIYISPFDKSVDEKWRGIGIRIEDDVLVTEDKNEVITEALPKSIDEIEALMSKNLTFFK